MQVLAAILMVTVLGAPHNKWNPSGDIEARRYAVMPQPFCGDLELYDYVVEDSPDTVRMMDDGNFCLMHFYDVDLDSAPARLNAVKGLARYSEEDIRAYILANIDDWDGVP